MDRCGKTDEAQDDAPDLLETQEEPRLRLCLKCSTEFESSWAGERICKRCKASGTWRSHAP